jgi:hypothetical protein
MTRIVYKDGDGVAIIVPAPEFLKETNPANIAKRTVPTGSKYKIVEDSEISSDRSFRNAWTVNEEDLTDGVGE